MSLFHTPAALPGPRQGVGRQRRLIGAVLVVLFLAVLTPLALRYRRQQLNQRLADVLGASNDPQEVQVQLREGADIHTRASDGITVLHFAAAHGDPAFISALLARGFPIDPPSGSGRTPLMEACLEGRLDNVRALLAHGANPRATSATQSALSCAVMSGNAQLVRFLVDHGADPNQRHRSETLLTLAARMNRPEAIDALMRVGVPVDDRNARGRTALMEAAALGRRQAVAVLLEYGASPALKDPHGRTVETLARFSAPGYLAYLRGLGMSQVELRQAGEEFQKVFELLEEHSGTAGARRRGGVRDVDRTG